MNKEDLIKRTKKFAIDVIKMVEIFPRTTAGFTIGKQLIRAATSVAANYRAALRAQSHAHFISKLAIVEEEADESLFWLELSADAELIKSDSSANLIKEANELTAIFTASHKTAKNKLYKK